MDKKLKTTNPATGEVVNEYEIMTKEQIENATKKGKMLFKIGRRILARELNIYIMLQIPLEKMRKDLQKL